jgi:multiple antibiotic resistance protein
MCFTINILNDIRTIGNLLVGLSGLKMESLINTLLAYFVIVDPIGASLVFNALTDGKNEVYCRKMAIRSVLLSTFLVLCFGFWGTDLLEILGIQMESFKIAGGLLIFHAAFGMITKSDKVMDIQQFNKQDDISVFPLSIPLIAGPGCLALTILQFSTVTASNASFIPLVIAIVIVYLITLFCFLFSRNLMKLVGQTFNDIFKRLLGVLLASLAIQFIADGIIGLLS